VFEETYCQYVAVASALASSSGKDEAGGFDLPSHLAPYQSSLDEAQVFLGRAKAQKSASIEFVRDQYEKLKVSVSFYKVCTSLKTKNRKIKTRLFFVAPRLPTTCSASSCLSSTPWAWQSGGNFRRMNLKK
jgi:hypothetical protein